MLVQENISGTIATSNDQWLCMEDGTRFILRRITPTECARLQGMPDWWTDDLAIENPTQEDIDEWKQIFLERDMAMGVKNPKPKSDNQIRKWLKSPNSDSAEYKMWGNGIALPCALYVMEGLKEQGNKILYE